MAKFIVFGADGRREFDLKDKTTLGRHPDNMVQLLDRIASKEHAVIERSEKGYLLRDLGSLNGTFVNKQRTSETILKDGDEISIGTTRCLFVMEPMDRPESLVTIGKDNIESHIRSEYRPSQDDRFLPEKEIRDESALRADYEKLRAVYELQRAIGLERNLEKLLERILEKICQFFGADRGVVLLFNESSILTPRCVRSNRGINKDNIVISTNIINHVLREKAAVLSSDASVDSRFAGAHSIIMQGIRSTMAVPISFEDDFLGILLLDSQIAVNAFTEKDLHLLTNIANQAAMHIANTKLTRQIEEEAATREKFQRLLSPNLVEQMLRGQLKVEKGGENREATVLFADIRGFTSMSENMSAQDVLGMLNVYFELMVDIVFQEEGTVDKFVGDEIMVLYGAPVDHPDDPARAVRGALEMQRSLVAFNQDREKSGEPPIRIGIGINSGDLVAGYIGSSRTMGYSVIGDTVNVASRLCSLAKADEILISEATYRQVKGQFKVKEMEPVQVKGRKKPIHIYQVLGYLGSPQGTVTAQVITK